MRTQEFTLQTGRQGYYSITRTVREVIAQSGVKSGIWRGVLSAHDRRDYHQRERRPGCAV